MTSYTVGMLHYVHVSKFNMHGQNTVTYLISRAFYFGDIRETHIFGEKIVAKILYIISNKGRMRNAKMYLRQMAFPQQNSKINSCKNK